MKKLTAVILTISIILSSFVLSFSAFAADDEAMLPHINMHGFMCCKIYEDKDDPDGNTLWPPEGKQISSAVWSLFKDFFRYQITRNKTRFMDEVISIAEDLFSPLECDDEGNPAIKGSGAFMDLPTKKELQKDPTVEFAYDWRLDPFESAADLKELIDYLCDDLGFGQVVIECHSNAGTILTTYFEEYGTAKVKSCCFSATSVYGAGVATKIIGEELLINSEGIKEYLLSFFANKEGSFFNRMVIRILNKLDVFERLAAFANELLTMSHDDVYSRFIYPIFGKWLNTWAMFPDNSVDDCVKFCTDNFGFDAEGKNKVFCEKLDNFKVKIRDNRDAILDNINENCSLYVFCFYDFPGVPVTTDWNVMSDGILYARDTSFGASFKDFLSTARFKPGDHVSPDGKCDGSSAKFPQQTWYFKSCFHILRNDFLNDMAKDLLYYDGQATVDTFEEYPQFLRYKIIGMTICPQ